MEARGRVRAPVFRSCFDLEGLLTPRGPKRRPRQPKTAPSENFGKILNGFLDGFGKILEEFWGDLGKVF